MPAIDRQEFSRAHVIRIKFSNSSPESCVYTCYWNDNKRGIILVSYGNHYIRVYRANSPRHAPTETKQHSLCNKTRHLVEVAS